MDAVHSIITVRSGLLIIASVLTLLLGLSYLLGTLRNKKTGFSFFLLTIGVASWAIAHSFFDILPLGNVYLDFVTKMLYVTAASIPLSFVLFAVSQRVSNDVSYLTIVTRNAPYIISFIVISALLLFSTLLVGESYIDDGLRKVRFGPWHNVYIFYIFGLFAVAFYHMVLHHVHTSSVKRMQSKYVLAGTASAGPIGVLTNLVLPQFNIFQFFWIGPTISLLMVFVIVYGMFKYDILDFRSTVAQAYAYLIPIIALLALFFVRSIFELMFMLIVLVVLTILSSLLLHQISQEIEYREKGERLARYLANANARLRTLDKQKTEFVSIASHQLRGPIAAIVGYASLTRDGSYGKVPKGLSEPLSRIFESGKRISIMVDDFLNVTRIEQGRMSYNLRKSDIQDMVRKEVEELSVIGEQKGLEIALTSDVDEPVYVAADESKLSQVFQNLIDNAIKYTIEGSIKVHLKLSMASNRVLITVSDTGIGIAADELQNLFQKFNRASNANTVSVYGAGLGLYIAREIVKAHDGWIHITSPGVGQGTTFTVELPLYDEDNTKLEK